MKDVLFSSESYGRLLTVVTPNVDFLSRFHANESVVFNKFIESADFCVCDSRILRALAKLLFKIELPLVTGSDFTESLLQDPRISERKVAFIGPKKSESRRLASLYKIKKFYLECPDFGFEEDSGYLSKLSSELLKFQPDFIFVAVGSPKQEALSSYLREAGVSGVALNIGASLDFLTGRQVRASKFMQKLHLEWLHRLLSNPTRLWKRYVSSAIFLFQALLFRKFISSENGA
ncbi:WecB/TagA/CpsF family glycosyltransferase [Microbulbifer mangrovi]|uniref:WecB/TagA/CpsF family glycosyltransferase n=1 Tax=Microbulbifer mangrovi TaxID=927787 RepID=UPI0013018932|nr:WecB/TagA/CpsF family glycosyltransferase [Microbulbifer mangrovi]